MKGNQGTRRSEYQANELAKFFVKEDALNQDKFLAGFEKLWVWQKSFELMQEIHRFCKTLPREERFRLRGQIERSSSSVCDNIVEGYTAYYYNDKIKFIKCEKSIKMVHTKTTISYLSLADAKICYNAWHKDRLIYEGLISLQRIDGHEQLEFFNKKTGLDWEPDKGE